MFSRLNQLNRRRAFWRKSFTASTSLTVAPVFSKPTRLLLRKIGVSDKFKHDFLLVSKNILRGTGIAAAIAISFLSVIILLPICLSFTKYGIGMGSGGSMLPTLPSFNIGLRKEITKEDLQIGQIICFRSPSGKYVIKRLIALGPCDLVLNGKTHRIPTGFMWVEGDNIRSTDSRHFGPIPVCLVKEKLVASLFPRKFDLRKKN